jgi:hypothetical protein
MLELDTDLLLGEPALQLRYAGRQILDFPDNLVQVRFLQQHDRLSTPEGKGHKERNPLRCRKQLIRQKRVGLMD